VKCPRCYSELEVTVEHYGHFILYTYKCKVCGFMRGDRFWRHPDKEYGLPDFKRGFLKE